MQTLKDLMRRAPTSPIPASDLDAETERLSGSHDEVDSPDSQSSDPIPDNFLGIPDAPPHDGSSSETWLHHRYFVFKYLKFATNCPTV